MLSDDSSTGSNTTRRPVKRNKVRSSLNQRLDTLDTLRDLIEKLPEGVRQHEEQCKYATDLLSQSQEDLNSFFDLNMKSIRFLVGELQTDLEATEDDGNQRKIDQILRLVTSN